MWFDMEGNLLFPCLYTLLNKRRKKDPHPSFPGDQPFSQAFSDEHNRRCQQTEDICHMLVGNL